MTIKSWLVIPIAAVSFFGGYALQHGQLALARETARLAESSADLRFSERMVGAVDRALACQSLADQEGCNIVIGEYAQAPGRRSIVIGDRQTTPPDANGFVNIGGKLCFWRDTKQWTDCPALVSP
jgi:hypothetical protein